MFRLKRKPFVWRASEARVAVSLSSRKLYALCLSRHGSVPTISRYATINLSTPLYDGTALHDSECLAKKLRELFHTLCLASPIAMIALPDSMVVTKILQFGTHLNEREVEEVISFEATRHFSYPAEALYLDFQVMPPTTEQMDHQSVLVAATRKENVQLLEKVFELAKVKLGIIDVDRYCFARVYPFLSREQSGVMLIDLEVDRIRLYLFLQGEIIFFHEERFIDNILTVSETLAHIHRALSYFSVHQSERVVCCYLSGDMTHCDEFSQKIQDMLHAPVHMANPFHHMHFDGALDVEQVKDRAPCWVRTLGLALRAE